MTDKALPTSSSPLASASTVPTPSTEGTKVDVSAPAVTDSVPPSNSVSPKKPLSPQVMFAALGLFILVVGAGVGFFLLGRSQEIRQQAAGGYADCAGGVKDGSEACSGFRELVICRNGAFVPSRTCESDERCQQANGTASCVKTARECAGGIKDGDTACSGLRTQVTCRDGSFVDPVDCKAGVTCQSGSCGGSTSGTPSPRPSVTPTASPVGACQPLTAPCDNENNKCCAGGVCQGVGGNRRCEAAQNTCDDPTSSNDGVCGGGQGWLGFRCSQLTNGQCNENPQTFSSYQDAYSYANANGCGQVDEVCVGGWKNRQLCGSFQIISSGCNGGGGSPQPSATPPASPRVTPTPGVTPTPAVTPTPGVTPSPQPSPSPAPVCLNVTVSKSNIIVGDNVSFTCGVVPGATSYQFRVKAPDGTISSIAPQVASGNVSQSFPITQKGSYKAQCRICVGNNSCQEWETL